MKQCRACNGSNLYQFIDFGDMPLANGFLTKEEFATEKFYPLKVGFCPDCLMVQLIDPVAPEVLFGENYPFITGSSKKMEIHFDRLADEAIHRSEKKNPRVIEIGSNDGTLLNRAKARGAKVLGFEPSGVADIANKKGIRTLKTSFDMLAARNYIRHKPFVDIIVATNTLCHVHDLSSVLLGVKMTLAPDGLFVFEDPYWPNIVDLVAYDQIYDEHKWYFSITSIKNLLERHGLILVEAEEQDVHGGSMRYWVKHRSGVPKRLEIEDSELKYNNRDNLFVFWKSMYYEADRLAETIRDLANQGHRIAGYGATSKSTTILSLVEGMLGRPASEFIDYITDTTPSKQGKFSPGSHIPITSPEKLRNDNINHIILFAWNHAMEIFENEPLVKERDITWLFHSHKVAGNQWTS